LSPPPPPPPLARIKNGIVQRKTCFKRKTMKITTSNPSCKNPSLIKTMVEEHIQEKESNIGDHK
jgi:hypothetical protein